MRKNHLLWLTLVPFLFVRSPIGRIVFVNGVLAHGVHTLPLQRFDIACNLLFGVYVGATAKWQPQTNACIAFALAGWQINRNFLDSSWMHFLAVQLPLMVAAAYF